MDLQIVQAARTPTYTVSRLLTSSYDALWLMMAAEGLSVHPPRLPLETHPLVASMDPVLLGKLCATTDPALIDEREHIQLVDNCLETATPVLELYKPPPNSAAGVGKLSPLHAVLSARAAEQRAAGDIAALEAGPVYMDVRVRNRSNYPVQLKFFFDWTQAVLVWSRVTLTTYEGDEVDVWDGTEIPPVTSAHTQALCAHSGESFSKWTKLVTTIPPETSWDDPPLLRFVMPSRDDITMIYRWQHTVIWAGHSGPAADITWTDDGKPDRPAHLIPTTGTGTGSGASASAARARRGGVDGGTMGDLVLSIVGRGAGHGAQYVPLERQDGYMALDGTSDTGLDAYQNEFDELERDSDADSDRATGRGAGDIDLGTFT